MQWLQKWHSGQPLSSTADSISQSISSSTLSGAPWRECVCVFFSFSVSPPILSLKFYLKAQLLIEDNRAMARGPNLASAYSFNRGLTT